MSLAQEISFCFSRVDGFADGWFRVSIQNEAGEPPTVSRVVGWNANHFLPYMHAHIMHARLYLTMLLPILVLSILLMQPAASAHPTSTDAIAAANSAREIFAALFPHPLLLLFSPSIRSTPFALTAKLPSNRLLRRQQHRRRRWPLRDPAAEAPQLSHTSSEQGCRCDIAASSMNSASCTPLTPDTTCCLCPWLLDRTPPKVTPLSSASIIERDATCSSRQNPMPSSQTQSLFAPWK